MDICWVFPLLLHDNIHSEHRGSQAGSDKCSRLCYLHLLWPDPGVDLWPHHVLWGDRQDQHLQAAHQLSAWRQMWQIWQWPHGWIWRWQEEQYVLLTRWRSQLGYDQTSPSTEGQTEWRRDWPHSPPVSRSTCRSWHHEEQVPTHPALAAQEEGKCSTPVWSADGGDGRG